MSKVSIVISVYNKEPWLKKCLSSLLSQTFSDIEFIVVDNGSTDNSRAIIDEYLTVDKRIKLVEIKDNIGPGGGISVGIDHVTSEYFGIVDADDYVDADYVEVLYNQIENTSADIVMCANDYVYCNGTCRINERPTSKKIVFDRDDMPRLLPQLLDHFSKEYLGYCLTEVGVEWAKLYRTSVIRDNNINYDRNTSIWCDWLFNFRVLKVVNKLVYTEDAVYHNSVSSTNSVTRPSAIEKKRLDEVLYVLNQLEEECMGLENNTYLYKARMKFYVQAILYLLSCYSHICRGKIVFKEEISCLDKIHDAGLKYGIFQYIEERKPPNATKKVRMRMYLLKKRIYFFEILNMFMWYTGIKKR